MTTIDKSNDHGIDPDDPGRYFGEQPSLDDLLGAAMRSLGMEQGAGWGGIESPADALAKQREESTRAMKNEANAFRDCFMTPAGRKVLEIFLDQSLRAEPYPEDAQLPMDVIAPLLMAHDVRCKFVRGIFAAIALAENRPNQAQDDER
ncbi:hypothetical protein [Oricola sp.]|uniref:hypothetical protein n=1 Tax=Oricola sp. TaxID=1979950 RepID=UPI0025EAF134|nr:hypothetical protein [Oricola sp.]MCI5075650.1 hypothetical protein [Oricola sp.]